MRMHNFVLQVFWSLPSFVLSMFGIFVFVKLQFKKKHTFCIKIETASIYKISKLKIKISSPRHP
jgi:ABC-type phosphate transport system permease subunit